MPEGYPASRAANFFPIKGCSFPARVEDFYRHLTGIIIGQQLEVQMECVKVIAAEGSFKNSTQLIVITRGFQFLGCASNCKIIDKDLADRKSTRLNSSHQIISYAVFCLK